MSLSISGKGREVITVEAATECRNTPAGLSRSAQRQFAEHGEGLLIPLTHGSYRPRYFWWLFGLRLCVQSIGGEQLFDCGHARGEVLLVEVLRESL
jgi:hypothetical protein